jgi:hypothetical protein
MNQLIIVEWLNAFYNHVGLTKSVLLTMDNFKPYTAALDLAPPSNIRVT